MRRRIVLCGLGLGVVAVSACGLDAVGDATAPDVVDAVDSGSSNEPDGTIVPPADDDASTKADADAAPPPVDTSCTTSDPPCTPPDGWQPVAMRIGEGSGCPESYDAVDLFEASLVNPQQACACTPVTSTQDPPRCDKQDDYEIVGGQGDTPLCTGLLGANVAKVNVNGNVCVAMAPSANSANWDALRAAPITASPGTCTPNCTADASALAQTTVHVCTPSPNCEDGACRGAQSGTSTADYAYCFIKDGVVAECPGNPTTTVRRVVGKTPTVECIGATCKNNATCSNPGLHLFKDKNCANNETYGTVAVDGKCNKLPGRGLAAIKYEVTTTTSTPVMDVQPTASVTYDEPKTLCCPKLD